MSGLEDTTNKYKRTALYLVRRFLQDNDLSHTLKALEDEAADALHNLDGLVPTTTRPLVAILEENDTRAIQSQMNQLAMQGCNFDVELETQPGELDLAFTSTPQTYFGIHQANILCIAAASLPVSSFPDAPYMTPSFSAYVTGSTDQTIRLSEADSGKTIATLTHQKSPILSVSLYPCNPLLVATTGMDGTLHLANLATQQVLCSWKDHLKYVACSAFSTDGQWLVTGSHDHSINIYRRSSTEDSIMQPQFTKRNTVNFKGTVESVCFLPSNPTLQSSTLIVGVRDNHNLLYIDLDANETFAITPVNMNSNGDTWVSFVPVCISPSPSGHHVAVYTDSKAGRIIIYQARTSRIVHDLWGVDADGFTQASCCWHPSGKFLFASSDDKSCIVYHIASGRIINKLTGHEGLVRGITFDVAANALVSCSYDRTVRVWPCA
ncbi:hypothetical protein BATDEDRAFT_19556 [Batrachochytrium dendrobatidis JAM81]|uniref:LisH domain-containing protein n=2 Tax=Batrachochytrium dendrobatidis TaxID=109871 RepID=F4P3Q6_BATDJ|nr:uncharacterized protein BATDEDRAFT_19556 [Batrachochytrium dendrobatidis JAM81]EGF80380.1 hypothetical protein BATDEDRAFT_19556 [Batrachochytrium dendrobatidis JAM81]KAK5666607.1 hypothetical protein QVD99_006677 [Batrachochytrium dendrobatidis]OAJ41255.1 hypothetical protein BDEG_24887 [Batrachochytrium dendrobatidis JEL423]|eukprot:XP_006678907.1 hypothetical protein BATDEDRAFT_19556 [Batrachochytrium dendrobatidis JAM81]